MGNWKHFGQRWGIETMLHGWIRQNALWPRMAKNGSERGKSPNYLDQWTFSARNLTANVWIPKRKRGWSWAMGVDKLQGVSIVFVSWKIVDLFRWLYWKTSEDLDGIHQLAGLDPPGLPTGRSLDWTGNCLNKLSRLPSPVPTFHTPYSTNGSWVGNQTKHSPLGP